MSKEREKEYLEKLGVPSKDYSAVPVDRTFSLDDILREVEGDKAKPAEQPAEQPAPQPAPQPKPQPEPGHTVAPLPESEILRGDPPRYVRPDPKPIVPHREPEPETKPEPQPAPQPSEPTVAFTPSPEPAVKQELPKPETDATVRVPVAKKPKRPDLEDTRNLKLFSTIEIEAQPEEYAVAVEEGGEPKVEGGTVVFAPPAKEEPPKKRAPRKPRHNSEAEPDQLYFEGAGPKNVMTNAKEEPVEKADADKVAAGFKESVENNIRENVRKTYNVPQPEEPKPEEQAEYHGEPDDYYLVEEDLRARRSDGVLKSICLGACSLLLLLIDVFALKSGAAASETDIAIVYLFISAAVSLITLALSIPVVKRGFEQLKMLKLRAEGAAVICTAVAILQNVILMINTASISEGIVGVYNFLPAVMLLFIRLGDLQMVRHIRGNMKFVSERKKLAAAVMIDDEELAEDVSGGQISGEARLCAPRRTDAVVGVVEASSKESSADGFVGKLFAASFAAAVLIALISAIWRGASVSVAFSVFTAALCAGTPLMNAFVTVLPLTRINRRLNRKGGAILNFESAVNIADANGVVISDTDVFPDRSIILHGMSLFNNAPMDAAIADTVSVLNAAGGALGRVFEGSIADKSLYREIDSIEYVDEMGVVCRSQGRELLLGSRDFMKAYQIPVPASTYEDRVSGGDRHVFYLAADMQLCAMYVVTYGVADVAKRRLRRAEDAGLTLLIATKDTNVTKEILSNRMKLSNATVKVISARALDRLERKYKKAKSIPAGVVVSDDCCSLPEAAVCAGKLKSSVAFNIAALIASAVIGIIFVAVFSLASTPSAIEAWKILIYALFWTLPVLVLSSSHK
ncbi:MAG: hypothetical protein IKX98_05210 [Clostridia bacterium]|nr:hypothetical protein [Clostridia bacterium]